MKKLKRATLLIVLTAAVLWVLGQFIRLPLLPVHPHAAVPRTAAAVLLLQSGQVAAFDSASQKAALSSLATPPALTADFGAYQQYFAKIFAKQKPTETLAVLQPTATTGMDVLFVFDHARGYDLDEILRKQAGWRVQQSIFKGHSVFSVRLGKDEFALARYRNLLLFARHAYLVENALSQLGRPSQALCRTSGFADLAQEPTAPGTLSAMFNLNELGPQFSPLLDPARLHDLDGLRHAGRWLRLDLPTNPAARNWQGSLSIAEGHPLSDAAASGEPKPWAKPLVALPDNLSLFAWLTCERVVAARETGLWRTYIAPWAGDEVAVAVGEPLETEAAELFLLLKIKPGTDPESKLAGLSKRLNAPEPIDFQMFKIRQLPGLPLDEMLLLGAGLHEPFATVLEGYVLFGSSRTGVERWLGKYLAGQTCAKDLALLESASQLPKEAHGFVFADGTRAWQELAGVLSEKTLAKIGRNPLNFNHLAATLSRAGHCMKLNVATPTGTATAQVEAPANILWRTPLAAEAAMQPAIFSDPLSGELEVFVQDVAGNIYLLSRSGRELWRRSLGEAINSKVYQLDLDSNGDQQFAFSTASGIYVVDATGADVAGFPLKLQTPATNGVTVVDFFQSNEYEFFIACENGSAYGFDEKGSPVEGWRPKTSIGKVEHPLVHFQAKGKDFLVMLDSAGMLQVFQKNGDDRFPKKALGGKFLQPPDFQADAEGHRIVACDDRGRVTVTNLEGASFNLSLAVGKKKGVRFAFADATGDERKDYLALSGPDLAVLFYEGNSFKKAFAHQFDHAQDGVFGVPWAGRQKAMVGTFCEANRQLHLLDGSGKPAPQFPLEGSTPFAIVDLLADGKPVVVAGNGASVVAYSLR